MNRIAKLFAALALATVLCFAGGGFAALAAPMPVGVVVWDVTQSTVLQPGSIPYTGPGDVRIEAKDASNNPVVLDLNGQSFTITGNLTIFGTLFINNGSLTVTGNVEIYNGTLKMTETNSKLIVKGNFYTDGKDHTNMLTAGALTVYGDFTQYANFSRKAFCPTAAFSTTLTGTNKMIWFDSPEGSWLNCIPPSSVTVKSASQVSLKINPTAGTSSIALNYPRLNLQGAANGNTLTVPGGTIIAGPLTLGNTLGGGKLYATGALTVSGDGSIGMENANDYVEVAGNFTTGGHSDYKAGTVKILGNFYQYSVVHNSSYHDDSYACSPAHRTILVGANKTVVFDTPASSYFGQLVDTGVTLAVGSTISLNCDLTENKNWNYPNLYYGGHLNGYDLTVTGDLRARTITMGNGGSSLTVSGNFTAVSDNCLVMSDPNDKVTINHNFKSGYSMAPASMSAGTLEIDGNFEQSGSATAVTASGTHTTKLVGTGKIVSFANPGSSYFNMIDITGVTFTPQSVLSMKADLAADLTLTAPTLYYSGNLGGHKLSVTGGLHLFGAVNPQGGIIEATGNVALDGTLTMAAAGDALSVGGDFTGSGATALSAGTAEFRKSFRYSGTSYDASGAHLTKLSGGGNMSVIFDHPESAWFSSVELNKNDATNQDTTLSAGSVISVKTAGLHDIALAVPTLNLQGNIGAHSVNLTGNLAVPAGKTLTIGGGNLTVSGNMTLNANSLLEMTNAADRVTVGGAFTAGGQNETGKLTDGILTIKGNFTQLGGNSAWSFVGSDSHATVLAGTGPQTVSFETPGTSEGSKFGRLYKLNSLVTFNPSTCFCSNGDGHYGVLTSADLATLTGTGGTMVPSLAAGQLNYIYVLPAGGTSSRISATKKYPGSGSMTMNGDAVSYVDVTGVGWGVNQTVDIVVSTADDIIVNHYVVKVDQLDTDLSAIGLSTGTLEQASVGSGVFGFNSAVYNYYVTLPASTASLTITPQTHNEDSTFTIGGQAGDSRTYEPKPGETISVPIVVTGQDGITTSSPYTISIHREPMLSGISASAGTFTSVFSSPAQNYTLNIAAWQSSVTLSAQRLPACTGVTIDGAEGDSRTIEVSTIGGQKAVDIVAAAGSATFTYHVTIRRAAIISGFGQSGGTLSAPFNPAGGTNTLTIPASMGHVSIAPDREDCTSLTINGAKKDSIDITPPVGGSQTVTIVAVSGVAPDTAQVTFTLTVTRKELLSNIVPSIGTLTPAFDATVHNYTVDIPATAGSVSVTPTLLEGIMTINGQPWDPLNPESINATVDPEPGASAAINVDVRDGAISERYTVTVNRQKPIAGMGISVGTFTPAFDARMPDYVVSLPAYLSAVTITPTKAAGCTMLTINGATQNSITLAPTIGGSATAIICATGPDGRTITTYTVLAVRQALLSGINLSTGTLSPSFVEGVTNYCVYLPNSTTSVTVTPVKSGSCASFLINGKKNVSKITLKPAAGGSATATVSCTGTGFGVYQTYTVTAYRIQPATSIKLSSGKLSPAFSMTKGEYTVSVPAYTKSVTITPARGASCASLLVDGVAGTSKVLSPAIGCSASTTFTAVAVNGQRYTYKVTVGRKALLKGIAVSTGSYAPAFSVTTAAYSMTVPATTSSVKVTPSKGSGAKTMKINGKKASYVTLKPVIGGSAKATIVVSDGKISQTYTLTVNRAPLLTGLGTSAGAFTAGFNPAVTSYTVNIPADATQTTLTAAYAGSGVQSIKMNGAPVTSLAVPVTAPGGTTTVTVVATASDGKTKATYTVAVKRRPIIQGITVTATGGKLSPTFNALTQSYSVSVPATTSKITLAAARGPDCTSTSISGVPASAMNFSLPVGGSLRVEVTGRTAAGLTSTYYVTLSRAKLISGIRTSTKTCPLSPAFSATMLNYAVMIPPTRTSITIYASKATGVKKLTMNGRSRTSLTVKPPIGGSSQVKIVALAKDGVTKSEYTVTVYRASLVDNITVSGGTLAFNSATHSYTVTIPASQASANIAVTKSALAGTVKINNVTTGTATVSPVVGGSVTATITVYYAGSTTIKDTYTVVVKKASS